MKAAVLTEINRPLVVEDVEPSRLQFGQVLVRVLASGICGAQLQEIRGEKGGPLPHLLGHEGCGIVEAIGEGVTRIKAGDKVVMHWRKAAGIESPFPKYNFRGQEITSGKVTTFAEYSICSENRLTPVPNDAPPDLCALLGCGLSTALATLESEAAVKMGESVLIVGCGGLGVNLILAARMRSAWPIAVADIHESKRSISEGIGANVYFNTSTEKITGTYDAIIDTAGSSTGMANALNHLAPSGRYIMLGQTKPGDGVEMLNACHMFQGEGKTIKATQGGGFMPDVDIPRYVKLWRAGLLNLEGIITERLELSEINRGVNLVRDGKAGRILIEMT